MNHCPYETPKGGISFKIRRKLFYRVAARLVFWHRDPVNPAGSDSL
jgi:hypothetical protein